jgi:dTDP-glucose pyrophosphorylase
MKGPILVVLAAGMGSRYGGLKQIDKIGAEGETLLDYSVYDALRSGFEKIVFIIRGGIENDFTEFVLARMKHNVPYELAFQELDTLIPEKIYAAAKSAGRTKPWGTCHALLCAERFIDAPFTVINADDFYGRAAFGAMADFLRQDAREGAIVPYRLERTLAPTGTVSRGVCVIEGGYLRAVEELKSIEKKDGVIVNTEDDGSRRELPPDAPVSMNFWGFPADVFALFHSYFDEFLRQPDTGLKSECYIPLAVDRLVKDGLLRVRSLASESEWFGVTYQEDKDSAVRRIAELTGRGVYPSGLWKN